MKKRLLAVVAALFVAGASSAFASAALGAQGGVVVGGGAGNGAITFKLSDVPCVFALDAVFGGSYLSVGLTADWWIANPKIDGTWGYYYGVGLAGAVDLASGENYSFAQVAVGPRAFVGTNVFILDGFLELYAQVAYQPMAYFGGSNSSVNFGWLSFPVNAGFRVWF